MSTDLENVAQTTNVETTESTTVPSVESVSEQNDLTVVNGENESLSGDEPTADVSDPEHNEEVGSSPRVQKRIKQLAAQKNEEREARQKAEIEREYYKGLAEGRSAKQPHETQAPTQPQRVPTTPVIVAPNIDDFETFEDYEKAKDEYIIQVAEHRVTQSFRKQQYEQDQRQFVARKAQETSSKLENAAKEDPAFAEIWRSKPLWDSLPINEGMAEVIAESPISAEVIKWIHTNRTEAVRIASLNPISSARALAMVEAKISSAPKPTPPKRVSAAPEPIGTINSSTSGFLDEDDLPMEEYYKRRTKQLYGRQK
jgi:hypothetical protein